MLMPQVITVLQEKCKGTSPGTQVEVDAALLKAALDGLQEHQEQARQIEQLQEQMSMKPSVARKLAEKIKKLEEELEITRDASRVKELERKVQKLELDLKQSYATKNFTLKQGLLDLEKKFRAHIYGHPDMEDLWHEVVLLLVEEKDRASHEGLGSTLHSSGALKRSGARKQALTPAQHDSGRVSEAGLLQGADFVGPDGHGGAVQRTVERIHEVHGREAPLALHFPGMATVAALGAAGTPTHLAPVRTSGTGSPLHPGTGTHHQRTASCASTSSNLYAAWSNMAADEAASRAQVDVSTSLAALRALFATKPGGPVFPGQPAAGVATPSASPAPGPAHAQAAGSDELDQLQGSVERLLELWAHKCLMAGMSRGLPGTPGQAWVPHGSSASGGGPGPEGGVAHPSSHVDASYLDQEAEAVLAFIEALRHKYGALGGGPMFPADNCKRADDDGGAQVDTSHFDAQADVLVAAIQHLRALWSHEAPPGAGAGLPKGTGASPSHLLGLPPLSWAGGCSVPRSTKAAGAAAVGAGPRTAEELQRMLLGGPAGYGPFTPQLLGAGSAPAGAGLGVGGLSAQELLAQLLAFMQAQGYTQRGGTGAGGGGGMALDAIQPPPPPGPGAGAGPGEGAEGPAPVGQGSVLSVPELLEHFSSHLERQGLTSTAASVATMAASSNAHPWLALPHPHSPLGGGLHEGQAWLTALTALRLSNAAAASGLRPGEPTLALLDASVLGDGMPTWWAPSLAAAAQAGNVAVATPSGTAGAGTVAEGTPGQGATPNALEAPGPASSAPATPTRASASGAATTHPSPPSQPAVAPCPPLASPTTASAVAGVEAATVPASPTASAGAVAAALLPLPPFNPLLLPGPARTMQAVMAHVRQRHASFLAQCPEAEQLLTEALAAAAELQVAQDKSLIRVAIHRQRTGGSASKRGTPLGTPTGKRSLSPNVSLTHAAVLVGSTGSGGVSGGGLGARRLPSNLSISSTSAFAGAAAEVAVQGTPEGGSGTAGAAASVAGPSGGFAFPEGMLTPVSSSPRGVLAPQHAQCTQQALHEAAVREIQPNEGCLAGAVGSGGAARPALNLPAEVDGGGKEVVSTGGEERGASIEVGKLAVLQDMTAEEYAAELEEVRSIAARHAEHAAALQELLARVATQHAEALERADDLEMRCTLGDKQVALLSNEVESLTRLLVDVKMAYAERDEEAQRLAQRLKRSLAAENSARDEVEELKRKLLVVGEEDVVMDADVGAQMQTALQNGGSEALGASSNGMVPAAQQQQQLRVCTSTGTLQAGTGTRPSLDAGGRAAMEPAAVTGTVVEERVASYAHNEVESTGTASPGHHVAAMAQVRAHG